MQYRLYHKTKPHVGWVSYIISGEGGWEKHWMGTKTMFGLLLCPYPVEYEGTKSRTATGRLFCGKAVSDGLSILLFYYLLLVCNDVDAAN